MRSTADCRLLSKAAFIWVYKGVYVVCGGEIVAMRRQWRRPSGEKVDGDKQLYDFHFLGYYLNYKVDLNTLL